MGVAEPIEFYRMYAANCAEMAAEVTDLGRRAALLEMAQAWRALAEKAERAPRAVQQPPQSADIKQ